MTHDRIELNPAIMFGKPVIMGRNTFESMGKPLQGRTNIVLTRNENFRHEGIEIAPSLSDAIALAKTISTKEVMIIGGASVYEEALPLASTIYLTRVMAFFPDADAHFPMVNWQHWHLQSENRFEANEKNEFAHHIQQWQRKYSVAI